MSKLIDYSDIKDLDYKKLGLICGLEIHQQLNTGKLFCSCPCEVVSDNNSLNQTISRRLRFSSGESGKIDEAALHEFKKQKTNFYKYNNNIACLVDLDEEPPNGPNKSALSTVIRVSQMLDLKFFNKIQFMRKLIIDGSVTAGFQRTAMLGMGGILKTHFGDVGIDGVNLEEDSSRVLERNKDHSIFALDRQGIPLIEITTGPDIFDPIQAQDAAKQIGNILRSFPETKRGLGTIRQDLNVSIKGGSRIEIKGAQNLKLIPEIIINEIKRQKVHLSILEELKNKKVDKDNFCDKKIYDISKIFAKSESKVIIDNLKEKNSKVLAIKLNQFKNILGTNMQDKHRFATEISDKNKAHFPSIKGLFHSDELPNYGITEGEVNKVRKEMKLWDDDAFIMLAGNEKMITDSLIYIIKIIKELIRNVPTEVRQVDPKGVNTKFLRPMPGSARMYPETDVHEIELFKEYLDEQSKSIPELYDQKLERLKKDFKLEENKIEEILSNYSETDIKDLIKTSNKSANYIYSTLFDLPKDIKKREKLEIFNFKQSLLQDILKEVNNGFINQNSIRDLFVSLYKDKLDEVQNLKEYLEKNNLIHEQVDIKEIETKIKEIVDKNKDAPFGALMGQCMGAFQGKVDGKIISEILKKLIK